MIKLPRLYVNGKFSRIVNAVNVSITQSMIPLSTATITLPKDENLPSRSYVELFNPYGSAGMFRVRSPRDSYGQGTTTADLEHMISEVGDYLVKEEINEMLAANTAMQRVFKHYKGKNWQLGSVSALGKDKIACEAKYDRVLDVMLAILEQKPDCMMAFDFTTSPWTVKIVKKGTSVAAEGRLARNITSAVISYDDTELVTRLWYQVFTKKDGEVTPKWVYKDASTKSKYGIVEGTVNTSSDMTDEEIDQIVDTYLEEHKEPRVSISMQGTELTQITGESMDKFVCGNLMRLALPDYNLTVQKHITSVTWNDVYNAPRSVNVNLGDEEDTVVTFLHNLDSKGSGGGGGGGKKKDDEDKWKEYITSIYQDDYKIELNAKRVDRAENILQQAGMSLDAKGVIIYAHDNEKNIMSAINTQADRISLVVKGTGKNAKIDAASIVLGINNQTGSYARIKAQTINLDGYVKATDLTTDYFKSKISSIGQVTMKNATVNGGLTCFGRVTGATISGTTMEIGGASFSNVIKSASVSGNTLTLTPAKGDAVTFSKATTLDGEWSRGKYTVTAKQNNVDVGSVSTTITNDGSSHASYSNSTVSIPVYSDLGDTGKEVYLSAGQLTNATGSLHRYNTSSPTTLYVRLTNTGSDTDFSSAGSHYWYYKDTSASLSSYTYVNL